MENICKLKTLNEGLEPEGLMDADESEYKGITSNRTFAD
jgi:hypothetical protein